MEAILKCSNCGKEYSPDSPRWRCDCGGLLDLPLFPNLEPELLKGRDFTMWRYRETLPVESDSSVVSFHEGYTPIAEIPFGSRKVLIKQDHLFPSGSYKDRGASVMISRVKELEIRSVVEDSSGNAGSAVAAYCALASIECSIYVPESTSAGKLAQIESYGAELHRVPGNREATASAVMKAAKDTFYASHSWNPYFFQGTKTFAYEVCEQLDWNSPDVLILPAGNGTLFLGAYIGFKELRERGIIDSLPEMVAVQTRACAPLFAGYTRRSETPEKVVSQSTMAEGIAIANPVRGREILDAVYDTGGSVIAVSEEEIMSALTRMHKSGYYIEPTSGAAIAGIIKYLETSDEDETIVSVFTGHGLKSGGKIFHG